MKRTMKQYKTVIIEHENGISESLIRRQALADNRQSEGFARCEGERVRVDVVSISVLTDEDL